MKIGITYDLKADLPASADLPDDFQEEFDSPVTIEAIAAVLRGLGHEVELLGDGRELLERLLHDPPDFVFNLAEGQGIGRSREARVPAVLEMLGIPYTGSDPLTLAVTLDKDCAKRLVQSAGVAVPRGDMAGPMTSIWTTSQHAATSPFTAIVKPAWEGSSKGIRGKCVVDTPEELVAAVEAHRRAYRQPVLVEEYIDGDGVDGRHRRQRIAARSSASCGCCPRNKRRTVRLQPGSQARLPARVRYECPAKLPPDVSQAVEDAAF